MKFILCLAVLTATICAHEQKISRDDAKKIFQESLVNPDDMKKYVGQIADMIPMLQPTSLSKEELVKVFTNDYIERESDYLDVYISEIQPKDLECVMELVSNPIYINYRDILAQANNKCFMIALEKTKEAALAHPPVPVSTEAIHPIIELQKDNFDSFISSSKYVIVDVYADWCNPCKMLAPIMQALSDEYGDQYTFAKLNAVEETQELLGTLNVKSLPTLILYKDGKEVVRNSGYASKQTLIDLFQSTFKEEFN